MTDAAAKRSRQDVMAQMNLKEKQPRQSSKPWQLRLVSPDSNERF